ncbi:MAG: NAD(+) kinase [Treponema sp. CETP13]|nr:MAG: NAD(+) kinase [Treponema sp. CETP13]
MKRCLIVSNTSKKIAYSLSKEIEEFLIPYEISVVFSQFNGENRPLNLEHVNFIVTLGGDGTVLYAARECAAANIPIFPINLGEFGFIAGIQPEDWKYELEKFLDGKETITKRSLVNGAVCRNGKELINCNAMNDVVISSKAVARIVSLNVKAGAVNFGEFKADGIIVSSPTGSTAYSAAAGGPIVDPRLDSLVLNPVSPFSLSNRPLVLPPEEVLTIRVLPSRNAEIVVSWDGQLHYDVEVGDLIIIKKSALFVRLAGCETDKFYKALCSKLHWSGGPHA